MILKLSSSSATLEDKKIMVRKERKSVDAAMKQFS
jgi:hypothetical protein